MPHDPPTWYFPIGDDQVYACDWDDDRQQYSKNCRMMPAGAVPMSSATGPRFDIAATLTDKTQPLPPNWFFPTDDRDWLLSCGRNPTTGRYDMNAHRIHLSDIGQAITGTSSEAGSISGLLASATREIRRKQPFLADVLLVAGAVVLLKIASNAVLGTVAAQRREQSDR